MRVIKILSLKNQAVIAEKCSVAERFFGRLVGLIGKDQMHDGEAMLFPRCTSVHMWFMRMPIDVVFLKKNGDRWTVTSAHSDVKPWKLLPLSDLGADDALELPAGAIRARGIGRGDELCSS